MVKVRNDPHHKATTTIAKASGRVVVETLHVAGMMINRRFARAIADAGMSGLPAKLEYKGQWHGPEHVKMDGSYASSKLCSRCRWKKDDLTPSEHG